MTRREFLISSAAVAAIPLIGNASDESEESKISPQNKRFSFDDAEIKKGLDSLKTIMKHETDIDRLIGRSHVGCYNSENTLWSIPGRGNCFYDVIRMEKEITITKSFAYLGMACFAYEAKEMFNKIGFFGDTSGKKKTYGILNEPNLNPFIEPNPYEGKMKWEDKGYNGIILDLCSAVATLRDQMGEENFQPDKDKFTIGLSFRKDCYLNTVNKYGFSVRRFIAETWKNCRIAVIPEFDSAHEGQDVLCVIADNSEGMNYTTYNVVCCDDTENPIKVLSLDKNKGTVRLGFACSGVQVPYPERIVRYYGI